MGPEPPSRDLSPAERQPSGWSDAKLGNGSRIPWWRLSSVADLRRSSQLNGGFLLLTVLSSAIATLGLISDSAAVIIGAMLIAPLLSPIMAIALASLGGRRLLLLRAVRTLVVGIVVALIVSYGLAWLSLQLPFGALLTIPNEVASRTHPGPFDLAIALAGGAAASYALVRLEGAAALFGVAIATALMPPLCTIGIGLALGDSGIWTGSATLFATNLVAIGAAAALVFAVLRLRPRRSRSRPYGVLLGIGISAALAVVLIPSAIEVAQQVRATTRTNQFADTVSSTVASVLAERLPGSTLVSVERDVVNGTLTLRVTAEVAEVPTLTDVRTIETDVAGALNRPVSIVLVGLPVTILDPAASSSPEPTAVPTPSPTVVPTPTPTATPVPSATPSPTPRPKPSPTMPATDT